MADDTLLQDIAHRLDLLVRLMAVDMASRVAAKGGGLKEQILALAAAGLDNALIAEITGASAATVRARRSEANKTKKTSKP